MSSYRGEKSPPIILLSFNFVKVQLTYFLDQVYMVLFVQSNLDKIIQ